jgi:hypothetical protein
MIFASCLHRFSSKLYGKIDKAQRRNSFYTRNQSVDVIIEIDGVNNMKDVIQGVGKIT